MSADSDFETLLDSIYDAPLAEDGWNGAVAAVIRAMDAQAGSLLFQDRTAALPETDFVAMRGYPDGAAALYAAEFAGQDQRIAQALAAPPGQVMADEWHFDHGAYLRTPLYNDFYRPYGLSRAIGFRMFADGGRVAVLSAFRASERGSYATDDIRVLGRVAPHLTRALQLKRQLDRAAARAAGLASGLDHFPQAVLLLDSGGVVAAMNAAADALLSTPGCPLRLREGRVGAEQPGDEGRIRRAVQQASHRPGPEHAPAPIVRLRAREGAGWLCVMAVPARRADRLGLSGDPGVLVFVAAPGGGQADSSLLARHYGLSQAEGAVAAALLNGESVSEIADKRGVSRDTVRSQVKSVLLKTGVTSQGKLIALMARGLGMLRFP